MQLTWIAEKQAPGVWDVRVVEDRWVVDEVGHITRPVVASHVFTGLRREREMAVIARRLVQAEEIRRESE